MKEEVMKVSFCRAATLLSVRRCRMKDSTLLRKSCAFLKVV